MANEFSITAATNAVQIDAQNQAVATFTVYNASGREVSGRAALETVPPNEPHGTWLQIEGERERRFALGGTEQYAVRITPPADAPPATYTFRLNMVETANPDEGFNRGTSVTFTVPEPKEPEKGFPIWIIPLIIGAVIVVGLIAFFATRSPSTATVPDVVGMTAGEAQDALEEAGFRQRQGEREFSDTVAENLVARTAPEGGQEADPDSRVIWFLSDGQEPTPTPTHTPTPTITPTSTNTPTPTNTPTAAPDLTATADALIEAAIAKYLGEWEVDNGTGVITRLVISNDGRTVKAEVHGSGFYSSFDNDLTLLGCFTLPSAENRDCYLFDAFGAYNGDPLRLRADNGDGITHDLTLSLSGSGEVMSVINEISINGTRKLTDNYALEHPERVLTILTPIFVPVEEFELEFQVIEPIIVLTPSP